MSYDEVTDVLTRVGGGGIKKSTKRRPTKRRKPTKIRRATKRRRPTKKRKIKRRQTKRIQTKRRPTKRRRTIKYRKQKNLKKKRLIVGGRLQENEEQNVKFLKAVVGDTIWGYIGNNVYKWYKNPKNNMIVKSSSILHENATKSDETDFEIFIDSVMNKTKQDIKAQAGMIARQFIKQGEKSLNDNETIIQELKKINIYDKNKFISISSNLKEDMVHYQIPGRGPRSNSSEPEAEPEAEAEPELE